MRHRPGRVEDDAGDFGGQRRRRLFGLADDHPIAPHHLIILDGFRKSRGEVDHHIALLECKIDVLEALERGFELLDALLHGDVERGQRARRHRSRRRESVAHLETLYGLGEYVVERSARFIGSEITADQKTLAQQIVIRPSHANCEFRIGRDHRPSAAHRHIRIAQRRLLDPLRSAFVEGRLV